MNFSVGVTLEINLSPRHIQSGTVLKYVREDGEGRERAEMRPLGGAGRISGLLPQPRFTSPGPAAAHTGLRSLLGQGSSPPRGEDDGQAARARLGVQALLYPAHCNTLTLSLPPPPVPCGCEHPPGDRGGSTARSHRPTGAGGRNGTSHQLAVQGLPPFQM